MTKKIIKFVAITATIIITLVVAGFFSAYFWLSRGERDATYLKPYVDDVLTKKMGGTPVHVGGISLTVNEKTRAIAVKAAVIKIGVEAEKNLIVLPQISLEVGLSDLFLGRIGLGDIALENLVITVTKSKDGRFYVLIGRKAQPEDPGIAIENLGFGGSDFSGSSNYYIKSMQLIGGAVFYYDLENGVNSQARNLNIQIGQGDKNLLQVSLNADVESAGNAGKLNLVATFGTRNMRYESNISFENFRSDFMKGLPAPLNFAGGLELPLTGSVFVEGRASTRTLENLKFELIAGSGVINLPTLFAEKAPITSAKVSGYANNNLRHLELNSFTAQLDKSSLSGSAVVSERRDGHLIELKASLTDMPVNNVKIYWPLTLYPRIREWVTSNIKDGVIPKAFVNLHLDPDEKNPGTDWPKPDDIDSEVNFDGASLTYLKDFPKISGVTGKAFFTGEKMDITTTSGKAMNATSVPNGRVEIRNFHDEKHRMFVNVETVSTVPDAFTFLDAPFFGKINQDFGFNPAKASGDLTSKVALDFSLVPNKAKQNPHDLNYLITATAENATASGILEHFDIVGGKFETAIDNRQLTISGVANVNGVPLNLKIEKPFEAKSPHNFKLHAATTSSRPSINDLGISFLNFIKGRLDFDLDYTGFDSGNELEVTADLKDTELQHKDYGLIKPAGEAANLKLKGVIKEKEKRAEFSNLQLDGSKVAIDGSLSVDTDKGELATAHLKSVKFGINDFSLSLGKDKDGVELMEVKGRSIDISPYITSKRKESGRERISIAVEKAISVNNTQATNFRFKSDCEGYICYLLNMSGNTSEAASFQAAIKFAQGAKTLEVAADNAGDFLRFMDSYPSMKDGKLKLWGTYKNFGSTEVLDGRAVITDFRVANAPVLAKLLSIASLTGILDGLNSTGISFTKLDIPFNKSGSTITVKEAKCSGPSVGLTGEGVLDEEGKQMNMKGTLVPAYALNSILGNVPVIGQVLTGGKGKGVFAFTFTATGKFESPDISVNPLSVIAPGFLRNLFSTDGALQDVPPEKQ